MKKIEVTEKTLRTLRNLTYEYREEQRAKGRVLEPLEQVRNALAEANELLREEPRRPLYDVINNWLDAAQASGRLIDKGLSVKDVSGLVHGIREALKD